MSRWFRHYAGMMRDGKLVRVAVKAKQPVERVVWVWGAILESAAEINDGGRYEFDAGEAAYFLRCDDDELVRIVDGLEDSGRVHGSLVVRWADRQFDSDSSKERQRRYRERRKAGGDGEQRDDHMGKASHSVTRDVTPPSRHVQVTLQETETETDIPEPSGSGAVDFREKLWTEGAAAIVRLTGKTEGSAKSLVGKWLRDAKDDCRLVLDKIDTAERERIGDPVSWISKAIQPRAPPPINRRRNFVDVARDRFNGSTDVSGNSGDDERLPARIVGPGRVHGVG